MVFIFRLIEFLFIVSVIRSVLKFAQRLLAGFRSRPSRPAQQQGPQSAVLKQDPVCGTYVAVDTSFKKISRGQVYHFCSAACRDRFAA